MEIPADWVSILFWKKFQILCKVWLTNPAIIEYTQISFILIFLCLQNYYALRNIFLGQEAAVKFGRLWEGHGQPGGAIGGRDAKEWKEK